MKIGNKEFNLQERTYVMGILNITPDSFSDGGKYNEVELALEKVAQLINDGADIIDVGGESTRPNHVPVGVDEEIERVVPIIKAIKSKFDIPVSIDTYKAKTAEAAISAGADLINDIWGLKNDKQMAEVIAKYEKSCCLMHNRKEAVYQEFISDVLKDLQESVDIALQAGISSDKIILDPGVGFAKNYEQNLEILRYLSDFNALVYPMLLGTSRKSVIGLTLDLPANEREEGTIVTTVQAVQAGWNFVRVHNVLGNARAVKMAEAILGR